MLQAILKLAFTPPPSTQPSITPGFNPINNMGQEIFLFSGQIFCFLKIPTDFLCCAPSKIYIKHSQEYAPASSTKTSAQNIFLFLEKKIWGFKMIWLFTKNIFLTWKYFWPKTRLFREIIPAHNFLINLPTQMLYFWNFCNFSEFFTFFK